MLPKSPVEQELEVSKLIRDNAKDENAPLLRPALDLLEIRQEDGTIHQCLTQQLLRESLLTFRLRIPDQKLPTSIVKAYVVLILGALDCLHTKCNYIHGGELSSLPWLPTPMKPQT